ncbi:hypothetical protein AAVH_38562 [Aphelenchoides avenae]|nr:hypothetical protein AAVH_38562 [Aphelenchus avenae]
MYPSEDAQEPLPLTVNGIESLVYTVDVKVGYPPQRFNLTLDTNAQVSVLFQKGFVRIKPVVQHGRCTAQSLRSEVFAENVGGRYLNDYPYVGLECQQSLGSGMALAGLWARDTYHFGDLSVADVPFILSNHTFPQPLNPRWASDGVFPLGMDEREEERLKEFSMDSEAFRRSHSFSTSE